MSKNTSASPDINHSTPAQNTKERALEQYDCTRACRICPFPGGKCGSEMLKKVGIHEE